MGASGASHSVPQRCLISEGSSKDSGRRKPRARRRFNVPWASESAVRYMGHLLDPPDDKDAPFPQEKYQPNGAFKT
jgi:hypothetical protein